MSLFEMADYRFFIRSFIAGLPRGGRGAINQMAAHLNVHSSLISQILGGAKDLNVEQAQELCGFMGLGDLETDFFILLVQRERAGNKKLKDYFDAKLQKLKADSKQVAKRIPQDRELSEVERAVFYSSWIYSAVRLFTSIGAGKTLEDISRRFEIPRARAQEILEFLVRTQLCREKAGVFSMGAPRIHLPAGSPFVARMHANWRLQAIGRSEAITDDEMIFSGPMSISRADFASLREIAMGFIKDASNKIAGSDAEEVACLNIDLFWVRK